VRLQQIGEYVTAKIESKKWTEGARHPAQGAAPKAAPGKSKSGIEKLKAGVEGLEKYAAGSENKNVDAVATILNSTPWADELVETSRELLAKVMTCLEA
jgi:hypothetical protein